MQNFQFKYQNIEDIKERIKKNAEKEYSQILVQIEEKKAEILAIEKQVEENICSFLGYLLHVFEKNSLGFFVFDGLDLLLPAIGIVLENGLLKADINRCGTVRGKISAKVIRAAQTRAKEYLTSRKS